MISNFWRGHQYPPPHKSKSYLICLLLYHLKKHTTLSLVLQPCKMTNEYQCTCVLMSDILLYFYILPSGWNSTIIIMMQYYCEFDNALNLVV